MDIQIGRDSRVIATERYDRMIETFFSAKDVGCNELGNMRSWVDPRSSITTRERGASIRRDYEENSSYRIKQLHSVICRRITLPSILLHAEYSADSKGRQLISDWPLRC